MFTAKDVDSFINKTDECDGLDSWIEDSLVWQFKHGKIVHISAYEIRARGWLYGCFEYAMGVRGFIVEYNSDQRDGDYYRVTYPPQER